MVRFGLDRGKAAMLACMHGLLVACAIAPGKNAKLLKVLAAQDDCILPAFTSQPTLHDPERIAD